MKALFAMDLIGHQCVRLEKGDFSKMTVYSKDPLKKIGELKARGAKDFHIIDLDGARTGIPEHRELIKSIRENTGGYMEVGGGIRTLSTVEFYDTCNIDGIIVGTMAFEDEQFFESLSRFKKIVLGLDTYEGKPMVRGWKQSVDKDIGEILDASARVGVMALLCTSIARDGMLTGPDFEGLEKIMGMTRIPVIASGGVSSIDDVKRLYDMGVWATILGKAVYEGRIQVEQAVLYAD